jgi:hypothetical protein
MHLSLLSTNQTWQITTLTNDFSPISITEPTSNGTKAKKKKIFSRFSQNRYYIFSSLLRVTEYRLPARSGDDNSNNNNNNN